MLTPADINPRKRPLNPLQTAAIEDLVPRVNNLLNAFGESRSVTSGFRSKEDQARINPKVTASAHMTGQAVDLEDNDGRLDAFCLNHLELLRELGLYLESPERTARWTHLQTRPPKSGHIVFQP
jgi:hypothetical protein